MGFLKKIPELSWDKYCEGDIKLQFNFTYLQ
jgi:hypothetical protein